MEFSARHYEDILYFILALLYILLHTQERVVNKAI